MNKQVITQKLAQIEISIVAVQNILDNDKTSDLDWDMAKEQAIKLDSQRSTLRSQLAVINNRLIVASKISQ